MAKELRKPTKKDKIYFPRTIKEDFYRSASVDILIPFYGQYKKVYELCKNLWKTLGLYGDYNICLIDDASPNNHFATGFESAPRTTVIQNDKRLGFGGALNVGFEKTDKDFVLIMHSDCIPESQNWLKELFRTLFALRESGIGMVSPLTNNPGSGPECLKMTKTQFTSEKERKNFILKKGCLPLYCALAPRDVFHQIGGFVKSYPIGWYEDEELAHRMRACGFQLGVSGKSWVRHEGGATVNSIVRVEPDAQKIMESNKEKCIADMQRTNSRSRKN